MIAARFDILSAMSGSLDTSGTGGGAGETLGGVSATVAAVQFGQEAPVEVGLPDEALSAEGLEALEQARSAENEGDGSEEESEAPKKTAAPRSGRGARAQATVPSE